MFVLTTLALDDSITIDGRMPLPRMVWYNVYAVDQKTGMGISGVSVNIGIGTNLVTDKNGFVTYSRRSFFGPSRKMYIQINETQLYGAVNASLREGDNHVLMTPK
jgi:hypothetical protein